MVYILKFSKGHKSVNNVGGVMVLVLLSTLSDSVLYLYQVNRFSVTDLNNRVNARVVPIHKEA